MRNITSFSAFSNGNGMSSALHECWPSIYGNIEITWDLTSAQSVLTVSTPRGACILYSHDQQFTPCDA